MPRRSGASNSAPAGGKLTFGRGITRKRRKNRGKKVQSKKDRSQSSRV